MQPYRSLRPAYVEAYGRPLIQEIRPTGAMLIEEIKKEDLPILVIPYLLKIITKNYY